MGFSKSKKADLSLSINAIVILILAITILGLGLTFVRGLFDKAGKKIGELPGPDISNYPTQDNPLTFTPDTITVRKKEIKTMTAAFLNLEPGTLPCKISIDETNKPAEMFKYNKAYVNAEQDKTVSWTIAVTPARASSETYLYRAEVLCKIAGTDKSIVSKDFVVTVTD